MGLKRKKSQFQLGNFGNPGGVSIFQKCLNYEVLSEPIQKREQTLNLPIFNLNMSVREGQLPLIFSQIQKLPDDDPRGGRGEA